MKESEPKSISLRMTIGSWANEQWRKEIKGKMVMKCKEIREVMPDLASGLMEVTPEIGGTSGGVRRVRREDGRVPADDGVAG